MEVKTYPEDVAWPNLVLSHSIAFIKEHLKSIDDKELDELEFLLWSEAFDRKLAKGDVE